MHGQLPNGRAAGIPYELWKAAPEPVNGVHYRDPRSWLGGLVSFLFKNGDRDVAQKMVLREI